MTAVDLSITTLELQQHLLILVLEQLPMKSILAKLDFSSMVPSENTMEMWKKNSKKVGFAMQPSGSKVNFQAIPVTTAVKKQMK